jgi:hypothetical protein
MTFGDISAKIADVLAEKASCYDPKGCAALDALVYVDLHNRYLYPPKAELDAKVDAMDGARFQPCSCRMASCWKRSPMRLSSSSAGWEASSMNGRILTAGSRLRSEKMTERKLPPLPGTAPDGAWRIGTIDRDMAYRNDRP